MEGQIAQLLRGRPDGAPFGFEARPKGAGMVLNLFQFAPDRFIHEPAGLNRDHPRAISGADVGFQIGFHFTAPSFERGAPHAAL